MALTGFGRNACERSDPRSIKRKTKIKCYRGKTPVSLPVGSFDILNRSTRLYHVKGYTYEGMILACPWNRPLYEHCVFLKYITDTRI